METFPRISFAAIVFLGINILVHVQGSSASYDLLNKNETCTRSQSAKKVICYLESWSLERSGEGRFGVRNIINTSCTHIMYSFAKLNPKTLTMDLENPKLDEKLIPEVTALKSRGFHVMISLGGWGDSKNGTKYSEMINNGRLRARFVQEAVRFLNQYNFDGLDLDWEYPRCWWGNCSAGPPSDPFNFANLIEELNIAFRFHGFLLSLAVAGSPRIAEQAYEMKRISRNVDWIGVMSYDLQPIRRNKTGHHSPLFGPFPNTVDALTVWRRAGVPSNKLIMGIPFYGRSYTLKDPNIFDIGAPAGEGKPADFTQESSFIAYHEFCSGPWTYHNVPGVGNYAVKGDQWVSYNDADLIQVKVRYGRQYRLGGFMIWAIDLDDFTGRFCKQGKFPLLNALNKALIN